MADSDQPPAREPKTSGGFFKKLFKLCIVGAVLAALLVVYAYVRYTSSGPLAEDKVIIVEKGQGLNAIAGNLQAEGVLVGTTVLRAFAKLTGDDTKIHAGEYKFEAGISPQGVMQLLVSGETLKHPFTMPEGWTSHQVVAELNATEGLTGEVVIVPAEGSLLPETYFYSYGDDRKAILERMQASMEAALTQLWGQRDVTTPIKTLNQALIVASIVEKETGIDGERGLVASVFVNRMRIGMPLQSDPTVIYAITKGEKELGRPLYFKDLKVDSPYNTYKYKELPPTPIANPGIDSIKAVLNPPRTDYLYFVADGTGGHVFATSLEDHNRNVAKWRKIKSNLN